MGVMQNAMGMKQAAIPGPPTLTPTLAPSPARGEGSGLTILLRPKLRSKVIQLSGKTLWNLPTSSPARRYGIGDGDGAFRHLPVQQLDHAAFEIDDAFAPVLGS